MYVQACQPSKTFQWPSMWILGKSEQDGPSLGGRVLSSNGRKRKKKRYVYENVCMHIRHVHIHVFRRTPRHRSLNSASMCLYTRITCYTYHMCMYVYIHAYTYTFACSFVFVCVCFFVCLLACLLACCFVCLFVCLLVCLCISTDAVGDATADRVLHQPMS